MGDLLCCFFVDGDSVRQIPNEMMVRVTERKEKMPEYRGKAVKFVEAFVAEDVRIPESVHMRGCIRYFDDEGYLDEKKLSDEIRLYTELNRSTPAPGDEESTVVEAAHRFIRKRLDDEHNWKPDEKTVAKITELLCGTRLRPWRGD